jgi:agmatinase
MSSKQEKINNFDPSQPGLADASIFGLPFDASESEFIILPAPWEVTVSYGSGASEGPEAIFEASFQVDLLHQKYPKLWEQGIYMDEIPEEWLTMSRENKALAQPIIAALENGEDVENNDELSRNLKVINAASTIFNNEVKERTLSWLNMGKKVVLLGGDHSTPMGYYEALATKYENFGILHFDAHMDLRVAYEGFTYSHASIMYNTIQLPQISKLVQVGIRDFSEGELHVINNSTKVKVFTDADMKAAQFNGKTWHQQCEDILAQLPENIAVSFDIDALQRWYCPNTGTPVPGGLSYEQATYLLDLLAASGKKIIGMDLVEVAPGEDDWDGNVGARLLFHMCGVYAKNAGLEIGNPIQF